MIAPALKSPKGMVHPYPVNSQMSSSCPTAQLFSTKCRPSSCNASSTTGWRPDSMTERVLVQVYFQLLLEIQKRICHKLLILEYAALPIVESRTGILSLKHDFRERKEHIQLGDIPTILNNCSALLQDFRPRGIENALFLLNNLRLHSLDRVHEL